MVAGAPTLGTQLARAWPVLTGVPPRDGERRRFASMPSAAPSQHAPRAPRAAATLMPTRSPTSYLEARGAGLVGLGFGGDGDGDAVDLASDPQLPEVHLGQPELAPGERLAAHQLLRTARELLTRHHEGQRRVEGNSRGAHRSAR
jgi:hypothetical protein